MTDKGKKVLAILGLTLLVNVGIEAKASSVKVNEIKAVTVKNSEEAAAVKVAEEFINGYIGVPNDNFGNWYYSQPVSKKFKSEYDNIVEAFDLEENILSGEKKESELTKEEKDLLKKYDYIEYDPIFGAGIMDVTESSFKVTSYNTKTGNMVLKDVSKKVEIDFPVKVLKEDGKWVVDGAGGVNIPVKK